LQPDQSLITITLMSNVTALTLGDVIDMHTGLWRHCQSSPKLLKPPKTKRGQIPQKFLPSCVVMPKEISCARPKWCHSEL